MTKNEVAGVELHRDELVAVYPAWSGDPGLVRVAFAGISGHMAAHNLLSLNEANQRKKPPVGFEYAGGHAGMPTNEVWAMFVDTGDVASKLPTIIRQARAAAKQEAV